MDWSKLTDKRGDFGTTDNRKGKISKDDGRIFIIGKIDSLLVKLGKTEFLSNEENYPYFPFSLVRSHCRDFMAILMEYKSLKNGEKIISDVEHIYEYISDEMNRQEVPFPNHWVDYNMSLLSNYFDECSTIIREIEVSFIREVDISFEKNQVILQYFNRLSKIFYMHARMADFFLKKQ